MKWILITAGISIAVIVIAFSMYVKKKKSYFSAENAVITYIPSQKMREAVETYHEIMMAAAYENFSSEKEADYTDDMEWFSVFVAERIELYGALKSIDDPEYISTNDPRLRVHLIWTPNLRSDSWLEAVVASNEFDDSRLSYYWDVEFITGKAWGKTIGIGEAAWDVYFLYGADKEWAGETPVEPDYYMHQLGSLPRDLRLDPDKLVEETRKLLEQI